MNNLKALFGSLGKALSDGQKLKDLAPVLASYKGDDWKQFEHYNTEHYARTLVHIDDHMEMLVLCWDINQGCPVHDHPENGCLVRILQGEVTEKVYIMNEKPEFLSQSILPCGGITYKEGDRLLHEIYNHSGHRAASLHIYSPPHYRPRYFQK